MGVVDELHAAWNAHDAAAVAACFAEDGVREELIITQARAVGRVQITTIVQRRLEAMPDLVLSIRKLAGAERTITLEWHLAATHRGDVPGWPARGEPVAFPGASVLDLTADGLIAEERVYTDFSGPLAGAGLVPGVEPPSW